MDGFAGHFALDVLHVIGAWFGAVRGGGDFPVGSVLDIRIKDLLMHFGVHSNLIDLGEPFKSDEAPVFRGPEQSV